MTTTLEFHDCCQTHGDNASNDPAWGFVWAGLDQNVMLLLDNCKVVKLPKVNLARTRGLQDIVAGMTEGDPLVIPVQQVCRLHHQDRCSYYNECKHVHLCRVFFDRYFALSEPKPVTKGQPQKRRQQQQQQQQQPNNNSNTAPIVVQHPLGGSTLLSPNYPTEVIVMPPACLDAQQQQNRHAQNLAWQQNPVKANASQRAMMMYNTQQHLLAMQRQPPLCRIDSVTQLPIPLGATEAMLNTTAIPVPLSTTEPIPTTKPIPTPPKPSTPPAPPAVVPLVENGDAGADEAGKNDEHAVVVRLETMTGESVATTAVTFYGSMTTLADIRHLVGDIRPFHFRVNNADVLEQHECLFRTLDVQGRGLLVLRLLD